MRYRRLLDPFFAPRRLAPLEDDLRAQVGKLLDGLVGRGGFDAIADLAVPYPSQVFLTLFGLPLSDREQLVARKDGLLKAVDPTGGELEPEALEDALGIYEYVQRYVSDRRHGDGTDLMTELLQLTDEGGLTDEDVTVAENIHAGADQSSRLSWLVDLVHPGRHPLPATAVAAVRRFDLEEHLGRRPGELPYGRRRLVGIRGRWRRARRCSCSTSPRRDSTRPRAGSSPP